MKKGSPQNRTGLHRSLWQMPESCAWDSAITHGQPGPEALPWGTFAPLTFVSIDTGVSAAQLPFRLALNVDLVELR
jgi:hypothetical protein